jgi:hypothetical protein
MSDGFEQAKGQRNALERLMAKIPGFRGFQDRELRRDVDKLQREHMSGEISRLKSSLRETARGYTDAGRIGSLSAFERLDKQLDGLSQVVRFSDYGATGFFDPVKIGEPELERVYQFDLALLDDLAELERGIRAVPPPSAADTAGALDQALAAVLERTRALAEEWRRREEVMSSVVQTGRQA